MSDHDLEIYQSAYNFTLQIHHVRVKLPKALKYDLGGMAFQSSLKLIRYIVIANGSLDKTKALQQAALEIDVLWQYLRLMYDLKGISDGEYKNLSVVLTKISRGLQKWLKWSIQQNIKRSESKARVL